MKKAELFLGVRKSNGQIGYISDGLNIPEFFELLRSKSNDINVLVDFSPVIERLHEIHGRHNDETILNDYNSLYNFWLDAKTYTRESLRISKSEELSKSSNSLINKLQLRLQKNKTSFYTAQDNRMNVLNEIKSDSDIYIDTLLFFIHSKASLEIESFMKDSVIGSYANFLHEIIQELYQKITSMGSYKDSFFKYIAFESPAELRSYLALNEKDELDESFLIRSLKAQKPIDHWDQDYGNIRQVTIQYEKFDHNQICMAQILRDLMYKIKSVQRMLTLLKAGNVQWDESDEAVMALKEFLDTDD